MIFGVPSPAANIDLQIAQWRINAPTNDPHAFTIDGSVPLASPRKDPRRRMSADLVPQAIPGDEIGRQGIWNDLKRAENKSNDAGTSTDHAGGDLMAAARAYDGASAGKSGSNWRKGDASQLSLGGAESPRAPGNPLLDGRWRKGDSFQLSFDGSEQAPRAPNPLRNPTWRMDPWKDEPMV